MSTIPTPRTDDELARLLLDQDLTNIDRREAMAEFARLLEVELTRLGESIAGVCRTNSDNATAMIAQIHDIDNLRRQVAAREADLQGSQNDIAALIHAALEGREFAAYSSKLQAALQAVAALGADSLSLPCSEAELARWNEAAEKAGYISLRAWVIDSLTKAALPHA